MTISEDVEVLDKPKRKSPNRKSQRLKPKQVSKMIEMHVKGIGCNQIAAAIGVAPSTVTRNLAKMKPLFQDLENVEDYRSVREQVLSATELTFLKSAVQADKLALSSTKDLMYSFDKVYNARRLEEGKSTQNVSKKIESFSRRFNPDDYKGGE